MFALIAFVLFLIVAIIKFLHGDLVAGLAFTGLAVFALSHVWERAIPGRA
jgi:hypothetical protein